MLYKANILYICIGKKLTRLYDLIFKYINLEAEKNHFLLIDCKNVCIYVHLINKCWNNSDWHVMPVSSLYNYIIHNIKRKRKQLIYLYNQTFHEEFYEHMNIYMLNCLYYANSLKYMLCTFLYAFSDIAIRQKYMNNGMIFDPALFFNVPTFQGSLEKFLYKSFSLFRHTYNVSIFLHT